MHGRLGPLELGRRLGVDHAGASYEATLAGRPVVARVLDAPAPGDEAVAAALLEEARAVRAQRHDHIVEVIDCGVEEDRTWVAMEPVAGASLERVLRSAGRLSVNEALAVCLPVLAALDHAHAHGIVHGDVRPHHVLVSHDGDVKLTDFGVARAARQRQRTASGELLGDPCYLAPEQLGEGRVDARTDELALALVLFECLVGTPAYQARNDAERYDRVRAADIPELQRRLEAVAVDSALIDVLRRALARHADARFPSCGALAAALAPFCLVGDGAARRALIAALVAREVAGGRTADQLTTMHETPTLRVRAIDPLADVTLPPRFVARGVIGRGGMGVVLDVLDQGLGREVAVKLLAPDKRDPVHRTRFRREAKAAAALRHPNIVTVFDVDTERDFIVMERVRGESLRARLQREGKLPVAEVRRIAHALLDALEAAHQAGIVHRDVKPANILIDEAGVVKLVDFGIASFGDRDLTSSGVRIGTPAYMAPEQLRGRVADVRADVYAAGATLFEVATGLELHERERAPAEVVAIVRSATGDEALARALGQAVAALPGDRFASARAFARAIGDDVSTLVAGAPPPLRWTNVRALRFSAVVLAGVLAVALAVHAVQQRIGANPPVTTSAPTALPVIALVPFHDSTGEARLDFAAAGLPHILASELRTVAGLTVIDSWEIRDRMRAPPTSAAQWREAARGLGAAVVVEGALDAAPGGVRMRVTVESFTSGALASFERVTAVDAVPATIRGLATEVATAVAGRATGATTPRALELERDLQLAIAALEQQDLGRADALLQHVELRAPDLAEAQYYRALLNWWLSRDVQTPATRALAGDLAPAQRAFLEGLRLQSSSDALAPAIAHFRAAVAAAPGQRDLEYGLFEALFHGGFPDEALAVYRRLGDRHPRFKLGLRHALARAVSQGDDDGMSWALARVDAAEAPLWQARAAVARRDYAAAATLLRRYERDAPAQRRGTLLELLGVYYVDGQLDLAADLTAKLLREDPRATATALLGVALATGRDDLRARWSDKAAAAAELATGPDERERGFVEVAAVELSDPRAGPLARVRQGLGANGPVGKQVARTLVAVALDDDTAVGAASHSAFPEVAAIAEAAAAERAGDHRRASAAWQRAAARSIDGSFVIVEQLHRAHAAHARRDDDELLAACDEVIRPRLVTWAWGGAVGPCLRWSAEAYARRGRSDDAQAQWRRLAALRAGAPASDALLVEAQAALASK